MAAPALAIAAPVAVPAAAAGGTVIAFPVAATAGAATAGGGLLLTAEALVPALLGGAALATVAGGSLIAGGAAMSALDSWRDFSKTRIPELRAKGMTYAEAQKQAGREFKAQNPGGPAVAESKLKGGSSTKLRAEIPFVVEAEPDIAAAWDIAQGVLDLLRDNAAPKDDAAAFRRTAAAAYQRAKGTQAEADSLEYRMGEAIGRALLLVAAHEGMTAADWSKLTPPQLQGNAGGLLGTAGAAAEGVLGLLGIDADVDGDGDSAGVEDAVGAALGLFD